MIFKHNTIMIKVTENGSGLNLGCSGTPQYKAISSSNFEMLSRLNELDSCEHFKN